MQIEYFQGKCLRNISDLITSNDTSKYLNPEDIKYILIWRIVCSSISTFCCICIIFIYLIMLIYFRCGNNKNSNAFNFNRLLGTKNKSPCDNALISSNTQECSSLEIRQDNYKQRNYSLKSNRMGMGNDMIFCLILSNLGYSIGSFIGGTKGYENNTIGCQAQAFIQNFFEISSICWNTIISYFSYSCIRHTYCDLLKKYVSFWLRFIIWAYVLPLILSFGPLLTEDYGPSGPWCWVKLNYDGTKKASNLIWVGIIIFFNWFNVFVIIYLNCKAGSYFFKRKSEIKNDLDKIDELKFLNRNIAIFIMIPIVLIFTRIINSLNRLYYYFWSEDSFNLFCLQAIFSSLQGFFNCLIFSYHYKNAFNLCKKDQIQPVNSTNVSHN